MTEVTRYARSIDHVRVDVEATRFPTRPRVDARREELSKLQRALRSAVREEPRPGLFIFIAAEERGQVGRLWLSATKSARAGVIGRHDLVDLPIGFSAELSLRHAMFIVRQVGDCVRFTVLDLDTPNGLVSGSDTPIHLLEADGLLSFRTGPFSFFCAPTGPCREIPEDVDAAWLRFDAQPARREAPWRRRLREWREASPEGLLTVHSSGACDTYPIGAAALARGVLVGRSERCGVRVRDGAVSRVHALLFTIDGVPHVIDAGSTNGTWRLDEEVRCQPLRHDDVIALGCSSTTLRWSRMQ